MKRRLSFLLLVFVMVLTLGSVAQAKKAPSDTRAMWIWNFFTAGSTQEQRNDLFDFSEAHGINLLFMNTGLVLNDNQEAFAALIDQAHQKGIRVYSLDGDASWALQENHAIALARIQEVLDFNKSHKKTKFDGIQHDVEPYILPEFFPNIDTLGVQYLDLIQKSADLIRSQDKKMKFDYAIPFWYEQAEPPVAVTYKGVNKPLSYHILDITDSVSVMSYRDSAEGQIDAAKQEIEYAASIGKVAYVGTETMPPDGDGIPDFITYNDEGKAYMETQLQQVKDYFQGNAGFGGIAIHWYWTYKDMPE